MLYKDLNKVMKVIAHSFLYSLLVKIDLVFVGLNPECLLKFDGQLLERSGTSVVEFEMRMSCAVAKKTGLLNLGRLGSVVVKSKMSRCRREDRFDVEPLLD